MADPFKNVVGDPRQGPYRCPCCGYITLRERAGFQICDVCFWEDDGQDDHDADTVRGGPNGALSLSTARRNYRSFGACDAAHIPSVRAPLPKEAPTGSRPYGVGVLENHTPKLPSGWTLERIRAVSGDREAIPLRTDRKIVYVNPPREDEPVDPEIVLGFHGLCLVKRVDDDDWFMGSLNDDGSVDLWCAYGNLYEALRGLCSGRQPVAG